MCGFVETSPGEFGFMPKDHYMQFERVTNDKDSKSPMIETRTYIHPEKVHSFLNDIYDEAVN